MKAGEVFAIDEVEFKMFLYPPNGIPLQRSIGLTAFAKEGE